MIPDKIPPTKEALYEALSLTEDILRNIELNQIPLTNITLKIGRLARLLNEFDFQEMMGYEAGGYPSAPDGVSPDVWKIAILAERKLEEKNTTTGKILEYIYTESIAELEEQVKIAEVSLAASRDPDVSVSSANPYQHVYSPTGNIHERQTIRTSVITATKRLASRRTFIYNYVLQKYYELKYSTIADDVFTRIRSRVDSSIGKAIPDAVQQFTSVYENLKSQNPEDWSNAVHSCRRILQALADVLFPPSEKEIIKTLPNDEKKRIKLGKDEYINRLIAFVENNTSSDRFKDIVGSHLAFLGNRLDSVCAAAQKGTHSTVSKEEADRYVVYTYLVVGDILSLRSENSQEK